MRMTPAARMRTPPASSPVAIQGNAGIVAVTPIRTATGRDPSAFMAATVQLPLLPGQVRVWVPGPAARAAQMPARAGAVTGAPPLCPAYRAWYWAKPRTAS